MDKNIFINYLQNNLSEILLEPSLFYNTSVGVRFELGIPNLDVADPLYFENVIKRSVSLFESIFSDSNQLFIVMKTYESLSPCEIMNPGVNVFTNYVNTMVIDNVACYEEIPEVDEDTKQLGGYSRSYCLLCSLEDVDYKGILKAIGFTDFPDKGECISDNIYFIHPKKNIVLHMYDDCGMDIVGTHKEDLMPLYQEFNEWILDYDRETVDQIFA